MSMAIDVASTSDAPLVGIDRRGARTPVVGVLVMALLEDRFNMTGHIRGAAQATRERYLEAIKRLGADVLSPGLVESPEDADRANRELRSTELDLLICIEVAYIQGSVVMRAIRDVTAPILVWNAQTESALPAAGNFDFLMTNNGSAGVPDMTNALLRTGRPFEMVTGVLGDERVESALAQHLRAAASVGALRRARIGVVGHEYQFMADIQIDRLQLLRRLGPLAVPIEPDEWATDAASQPHDAVEQVAMAMTRRYRDDGVAPGMLERVARSALALDSIVTRYSLDALAVLEQAVLPYDQIGVIPSLAESLLMAGGLPVAAELDLGTATAMVAIKAIAGHCTFLESSFLDFTNDCMYLTHDGLGNPDLADPGTLRLTDGIYYRGVNGMGPAAEYVYRPGPVTLLSVASVSPGDWRMIVAEGDAEPCPPRPVAAPQMLWRFSGGTIGEYFDRYCKAGGIHHFAGAYGKYAAAIEQAARYMGISVARL
jgi:L-arabinose isomerase